MAVRSFVKATIRKVPFSQYIPVVKRAHDEGKVITQINTTTSSQVEIYDNSEHFDCQCGSQDGIIHTRPVSNIQGSGIVLEQYYPEEGVYYNRTAYSMEDIVDEYAQEFQSEICTLVDSSCPGSSMASSSGTFCSYTETSTERKYVEDQNTKFDELINNNIDVVLNGDKPTPNREIISMIYNNKGAILSALSEQMTSRLPRVPSLFRRNSVPTHNDRDQKLEEAFLAESSSENIDSGYEEEDEDDKELDQILFDLNDDIKIDIFLDSLEYQTKLNLYNSLRRDLQLQDGNDMFSKKNKSVIDKVQLFLIISIKLFMTGLKLIVPLTKYVYHKFQHNQFYLFNSKNADKLIDYILKLMNYLDTKLNNNEDVIDKISQHDYIKSEEQMEQIYKDLTNYAGELFDPSKVMDKYISKDVPIKKSMVEFFINRMSQEDKSSYEKNPKYNMYYSGRSKNPTPRSTTPKPNTSRNSHLFDR